MSLTIYVVGWMFIALFSITLSTIWLKRSMGIHELAMTVGISFLWPISVPFIAVVAFGFVLSKLIKRTFMKQKKE